MINMEGRLSCIWWHIEIPCISIPQKWTYSEKVLHSAIGKYVKFEVFAMVLLSIQVLWMWCSVIGLLLSSWTPQPLTMKVLFSF